MTDVEKGMRVLTPLGMGIVANLLPSEDRVTIELEQRSAGELAWFTIDEHALLSPLLKHFPADDPVGQYELWSTTDRVVELCTIRATAECTCGCKGCSMNPTAAWVLGAEPAWQGAVHETNNACQCLTASVCNCMNMPLPEIDREWFIRTVAALDK